MVFLLGRISLAVRQQTKALTAQSSEVVDFEHIFAEKTQQYVPKHRLIQHPASPGRVKK